MSVTIRLSRTGRKNQPTFKLVVSNTRDKRNGKFIDVLGHYNPFDPKQKFSYDKEKMEKWKKQGAFVTTAVSKLIDGKYEFVKYDPKKIKAEKEQKAQEAKEKSQEAKPAEKEPEKEESTAEEEKVSEEENTEPKEEVKDSDEKAPEEEPAEQEETEEETKDEEKGE